MTRMCPSEDSNLEQSGFEPATSANWVRGAEHLTGIEPASYCLQDSGSIPNASYRCVWRFPLLGPGTANPTLGLAPIQAS